MNYIKFLKRIAFDASKESFKKQIANYELKKFKVKEKNDNNYELVMIDNYGIESKKFPLFKYTTQKELQINEEVVGCFLYGDYNALFIIK